jgi:hypothetical protein
MTVVGRSSSGGFVLCCSFRFAVRSRSMCSVVLGIETVTSTTRGKKRDVIVKGTFSSRGSHEFRAKTVSVGVL